METVVPDPPKEEEKPTGNAELDKMIADGQKAISEMKRLDDAIEDEKISQDIRRLEAQIKCPSLTAALLPGYSSSLMSVPSAFLMVWASIFPPP